MAVRTGFFCYTFANNNDMIVGTGEYGFDTVKLIAQIQNLLNNELLSKI